MPNYNDLSRRALISMCNDYDESNGNELKAFLDSRPANSYESIRFAERMLVRWDNLTARTGLNSNKVAKAVAVAAGTAVETVAHELAK